MECSALVYRFTEMKLNLGFLLQNNKQIEGRYNIIFSKSLVHQCSLQVVSTLQRFVKLNWSTMRTLFYNNFASETQIFICFTGLIKWEWWIKLHEEHGGIFSDQMGPKGLLIFLHPCLSHASLLFLIIGKPSLFLEWR